MGWGFSLANSRGRAVGHDGHEGLHGEGQAMNPKRGGGRAANPPDPLFSARIPEGLPYPRRLFLYPHVLQGLPATAAHLRIVPLKAVQQPSLARLDVRAQGTQIV